MLDTKTVQDLVRKGREFMRGHQENDPYLEAFVSDQDRKLPQPPLVKAPMAPEGAKTILPRGFEKLKLNNDLLSVISQRKSARVYTREQISLLQLSFLLWSCQGVKKIRGRAYATLRTVPSGGARHPFELYLIVQNVEALEPGVYHYLPLEHAVERIGILEDPEQMISDALCGQTWAAKASVVFFWSMVAYRAEWRYGITAHRTALMDVGHADQNLYLACTAAGLGTCSIAAFQHETCCRMLGLDGEEEFVVYAAPVGTVRENDAPREQAFYSFVAEEGL